MKFKIGAKLLNEAMGWTRPVVDKIGIRPALSNILIEASPSQVSFVSSNSEIEICASAGAEIAKPGSTTVSAVVLGEIARRAPDGSEVDFDLDPSGDKILVTVQRAEYRLATLPKEDFPLMEESDFDLSFNVDCDSLIHIFDAVQFAISQDDTRRYLNGAYFHVSRNESGEQILCAVATDGYVMARARTALPKGVEALEGVIVPGRAVSEILRCLPTLGKQVEVRVSEQKIQFSTPKFKMISRLVEAEFPDYERLIPKDGPYKLVVGAQTFADSLQRIAAVAPLSSKSERVLGLTLEEGSLALQVVDQSQGHADDSLKVEYPHPKKDLKFNHRNLLNILSHFDDAMVRLTFQDDARESATVEAVDRSDVIYVIMPIA